MHFINNAIQSPRVITGLVLLNLSIWVLVIMPNVYFKGAANALITLKSSPYCLLTCVLLFCSISDLILFIMHKIQFYFLGPLLLSEKRLIFSNFIKDNPCLQLLILVLEEPERNSIEALIWSIILLFFSCFKAFCVIINSRLLENKLKNIEFLNKLIFLSNFLSIIINSWLFNRAGIWFLLMANFESLFIFKDTAQVYYQLSKAKSIPGSTELVLEIFENFCKIIQWLQLGFFHGNIFSINPVEFLIIIKLQSYFHVLLSTCQQYFKYKTSVYRFTLKYPALNQAEIKDFAEEKCCVCWDLINTAKSCRITCGHVLHIECIWKWMLRTTERKCPMCKQEFLQPEQERSIWSRLISRSRNISDEELRRLMEVFPHLSEQEVIREVERAGSVEHAIETLLAE